MHSRFQSFLARKRHLQAALILVAGGLTFPLAYGYTFRHAGVESNFLVETGRVVFAQADGSLTVLALDSGEVLRREKSQYYSGTLLRVREGVLMLNSGRVALLDPLRFQTIWETTAHYEPNVTEDSLVSYDGNGLVECRTLADGRIRWRYSLPGALEVAAVGGRVLVHRAAIYEQEAKPMTVLLDLTTGTELFSRSPPAGRCWVHAYLDETNICVLVGRYQEKPSDYVYTELAWWNARGESLSVVPISAERAKEIHHQDRRFEFGGKTFFERRVYSSSRSIPSDERVVRGYRHELLDSAIAGTNALGYDLGEGFAIIERAARRPDGPGMEIELRTPQRRWKGVLTYLGRSGYITSVGRQGGKFLIGTAQGQVECIDAADGHSRWLYVFPTFHHTMSFSSHGMPPTMAQAAEEFHRENLTKSTTGFQLEGAAGATRVVLDPAPSDPFTRLPLYLAFAWASSLSVFVLLPALHFNRRMREGDARLLGIASVLLCLLVVVCFFELGRVSFGSSVALRLAVLASLPFLAIDARRCYRAGATGWSLGLTIALGVLGGVALLPVLLSF